MKIITEIDAMNENHAELSDFFGTHIDEKSDALKNLDRAAMLGVSALAVITVVVISLIFFSI